LPASLKDSCYYCQLRGLAVQPRCRTRWNSRLHPLAGPTLKLRRRGSDHLSISRMPHGSLSPSPQLYALSLR
jgi:hypothetical protein